MLDTFIFCVLGILLFFWGAKALLMALIISSVFQSMAFVNLGTSPIIVYYFFGVLFVLRGVLDLFWAPPKAWWIPSHNHPLFYLLGFVFLAILGAFLSPQVFYGTLVYSPKLTIDEQFNNMTPLALNIQHFNQSIQLGVNALIFMIIWLRPISPAIFIRAIFLGLSFSLFIAFWQVVANITGIYFPKEWLYSVEGWSLGNDQMIGSFTRVNSTFLEPSVFATYLTGIFGFLLVWWVRRPSWIILLCTVLTIGAMLITTSTTAYLGLVSIITCILCVFGLLQLVNGGWISKTLLAIVFATGAFIWLSLIAFISFNDIRDLANLVLLQKSDGDSFRVRIDSDLQSFKILWQTYGFGVGLGSNRPSSFFTFLLSNVGIMGFVSLGLFLIALTRLALQSTKHLQQTTLHEWAVAGAWGLWATIIAKITAQPDLSFSPMWAWIFFLASLCSISPILSRKQGRTDLAHSTTP